MSTTAESWLGRGVYTIPEAALYAGIPARTARRWFSGRAFTPGYPELDGQVTVDFLDLVELAVAAGIAPTGNALVDNQAALGQMVAEDCRRAGGGAVGAIHGGARGAAAQPGAEGVRREAVGGRQAAESGPGGGGAQAPGDGQRDPPQ